MFFYFISNKYCMSDFFGHNLKTRYFISLSITNICMWRIILIIDWKQHGATVLYWSFFPYFGIYFVNAKKPEISRETLPVIASYTVIKHQHSQLSPVQIYISLIWFCKIQTSPKNTLVSTNLIKSKNPSLLNFIVSSVRHVTGNDQDYLRKIPRVVVQKSALL